MNPLDELIGNSRKMVGLRQQAHALLVRQGAARRLPPILIQGETGTGKGLLARVMHRAGLRASAPFVDLNCAAIPETLLEAELFGYERGAFTDARHAKPGLFQVARGGTLFLDEIGLLPRGLQAKLLTVVEDGNVRRLGATRSEPTDVSIITATNEPLLSAVLAGRFREDLYHRLAVVTLELPPLRDRSSDIDLLADRLLGHVCAEYGVPARELAEEARQALRGYRWPGNVRELGNVLERAVLMSDSRTLNARALDLPTGGAPPPSGAPRAPEPPDSVRQRLLDAFERTGGNISRTAALLGITRNTVRARIRTYGLRPPPTGDEPARATAAAGQAGELPQSSETGEMAAAPANDRMESLSPTSVHWARRRVTFLRAHVRAALETPSSVIARVLGALVDKVHSFGGQVNEVGRHGVVAVFGHQPAEDAPRRAATAALAMLKVVERERQSGALSADMSLEVGLHVERVTVTQIGGRSVIEQEAGARATAALDVLEPIGGDEVAVTDAAHGFFLRSFDVQPRPRPGPRSHRLLGRGDDRSPRATFIGRRPELGLLHGLLDRAMQGQGQIVTLVGEPGIGKSRLLREFALRAVDVVALEGHCASYGVHVPYFPVIEILQRVGGIEETDPIETVDAKMLAALRELGDDAVAAAPYLQLLLFPRTGGELGDRSPDAIRARTFEAIRQIILAQQRRRTLVLGIEDLQWIDQTSAELLAFLAPTISASRVLLVLTCRRGYRADWLGGSNATQLAVGPLSEPESRQLVESVLGVRPGAGALLARIVDRGDGNPLFLEELAHSVRDHDDEALPTVPNTLHDVVAARIEGLAERDGHVLDAAAVIGRQVPVALLQSVSGLSDDELRLSLGRLHSGEFLQATRFDTEAEYTFKHALTHEVAYANVPDDARAPLHARVLAALMRLTPETRERRPELLARHSAAAGHEREAIDHWFRAGQLAMKRSAHGDAVVHLGEALRLFAAQPDAAERAGHEVSMQLALATSLTAARGYAAPEIGHTLTRIRTLADQLADAAQELAVRFALWRFELSRADLRAAETLASQILGLVDPRDPVGRVGAHVAAGIDKFYLGEFSDALEHLQLALVSYDRQQSTSQILRYGQDMGIAAEGFLGWALAVVGQLDEATARADHVVKLAREIGHPFSLALALFLACEIYQERHDPAAVAPLSAELLTLGRDHSYKFFTAFGLMQSGWARVATNDVAAGLVMMREGADLFLSIGQRVGLAHRARLAEGLLAASDVEAALVVVADALERRRQTQEDAFVAPLLCARGDALERRGDPATARVVFREAVETAREQGAWLFALRAACHLARLDPSSLDVLAGVTRRFPDRVHSRELREARTLLGRES